jgi:hypothetical protein
VAREHQVARGELVEVGRVVATELLLVRRGGGDLLVQQPVQGCLDRDRVALTRREQAEFLRPCA